MKSTLNLYLWFLVGALIVVWYLAYESRQLNLQLEELLKDVEEISEMSKSQYDDVLLLEEITSSLHEDTGSVE